MMVVRNKSPEPLPVLLRNQLASIFCNLTPIPTLTATPSGSRVFRLSFEKKFVLVELREKEERLK